MIDVVVVGAGPVGLFTAALLLKNGHRVTILERREAPVSHSRAIGIHPPALDGLEAIGVAAQLAAEGVHIAHGIAYSRGARVAELDFRGTSETFPFILSVPQARTERVLEDTVAALDSSALRRGFEVQNVLDDGGSVRVRAAGRTGSLDIECRLVVAADGSRSALAQKLDPRTRSHNYPDFYLMGDFTDTTQYGADAVLFLEPGGIVESFPLPGGVRRWVVHLDRPCTDPAPETLAGLIQERTDTAADVGSNSMVSAFGVRSRLAGRMIHGRVVLLGDAAHTISPIGGQGMNLGWLDAAALAPIIGMSLQGLPVGRQVQAFETSRRRAAARASRQAGLNMALGRPLAPAVLAVRNSLFGHAVAVPAIGRLVARRFTMN